mmetsp:Transcript_70173/g.168186  ORF Transcript_70173/g.168186 Transcript_70173/m.168186 type:complete len:352 (-) Transcript_70173:6-1061(-)
MTSKLSMRLFGWKTTPASAGMSSATECPSSSSGRSRASMYSFCSEATAPRKHITARSVACASSPSMLTSCLADGALIGGGAISVKTTPSAKLSALLNHRFPSDFNRPTSLRLSLREPGVKGSLSSSGSSSSMGRELSTPLAASTACVAVGLAAWKPAAAPAGPATLAWSAGAGAEGSSAGAGAASSPPVPRPACSSGSASSSSRAQKAASSPSSSSFFFTAPAGGTCTGSLALSAATEDATALSLSPLSFFSFACLSFSFSLLFFSFLSLTSLSLTSLSLSLALSFSLSFSLSFFSFFSFFSFVFSFSFSLETSCPIMWGRPRKNEAAVRRSYLCCKDMEAQQGFLFEPYM